MLLSTMASTVSSVFISLMRVCAMNMLTISIKIVRISSLVLRERGEKWFDAI